MGGHFMIENSESRAPFEEEMKGEKGLSTWKINFQTQKAGAHFQ
jgi:hypothetical protein